jgi:hypothetical protein
MIGTIPLLSLIQTSERFDQHSPIFGAFGVPHS